MHKTLIAILLVISVTVLEVAGSAQMLSPPERPKEFRNPNELRQYLKELNEYYAIMGRPRFGKRSGSLGNFDYLSPNEIEDIINNQ